jgi:hypothetical protein
MPIREPHPGVGEPVDVRLGNPAPVGVVPVHVTITQIVGTKNDDVGAA